MRRFWIAIATLVFGVMAVGAQGVSGNVRGGTIEQIAAAVVQIETYNATGTGTIISPDGLIYTNNHVIEDANEFAILMIGNDLGELPVLRYYASLVYASPDLDFAVLKIDRSANGAPVNAINEQLPYLPPVHNTPVTIGDPIRSFGYPGTGDGYLISTTGEIANVQNGTINGQRIPVWYRTDAEISSGNSGGLVVNEAGEFVGIPTWVATDDRTAGRLAGILPIAAIQQSVSGINLAERETQPAVPRDSGGNGNTSGELIILNQSPSTICETYVSLTTASTWGEDVLGQQTLPPSVQFTLNVVPGAYDVLLIDCSGNTLEDFRNVLVSGQTTFTYTPNGSDYVANDAAPVAPNGQLTPFTLVNASPTEAICYVFISPVTSRDWGDDQLDGDEVIIPGATRVWSLSAGAYDMLLLDCNQEPLADERQIDITANPLYTYR